MTHTYYQTPLRPKKPKKLPRPKARRLKPRLPRPPKVTVANHHTSGGGSYPGLQTKSITYYMYGDIPGQPDFGILKGVTEVPYEPTQPLKWKTSWSRTRNGTPGYFHLNRYAPLPVHSYQLDVVKIKYAEGEVIHRSSTGSAGVTTQKIITRLAGPGIYTSVEAEPFLLPAAKADELDRRARIKVLNDLKGQSVNVAQMFAERGQTTRLILGTVRTLRSAGTALNAGAFRDLYQVLGLGRPSRARERNLKELYWHDQRRCIESTWLELQYGWKPLLQDVYGSMQALVNTHFARPLKIKASMKENVLTQRVIGTPGQPGSCIQHNSEGFAVVKYVIEYRVTNDLASSAGALGLLNPAQLAWELLPYSFVVDWFLPIGNALSQLDATAGLTFLQGTKTTFSKGKQRCTVTSVPSPSIYGPQGYEGIVIGEREDIHMVRDVMSQFPAPALPVFKDPTSTVHALNAIALLATTFKK